MSVIPTRDQAPRIIRGRPGVGFRHSPGPSASPSQAGGMTGKDVLRILRRRKWLIVIIISVCTSIAFVSTLLWRRYAPAYTATAFLGVNPMESSAWSTGTVGFSEVKLQGLKAAHANMMTRESFLELAVEKQEIQRTDWYSRNRLDPVARLKSTIGVSPSRDANLISISITESAPREQDRIDLAEIVNAIASTYVDDVRDSARQDRTGSIRRLQDKRSELQEQFNSIVADTKRKKLSSEGLLNQRIKVQGTKIGALTEQAIQLSMVERQAKDSLTNLSEQAKSGTLSQVPEVRIMVEADPYVKSLQDQEFMYQSQRMEILKRVGPRHRAVLKIDTSLSAIKESLVRAIKESVAKQAELLREQRLLEIETITAQIQSVKEQMTEINITLRDLQSNIATVRDNRAKLKVLGDNIARIDSTLLQLELLSQADRPVWLRARATRPKTISKPKWSIMMPLGILAGLAIGLGLAFLLELMDTSIKGPADLTRRVDVPVLGMIPHADDLEEEFQKMPLVFMEQPDSPICEAYRQIRSCLQFSGPASKQRSLLVTSPLPEDGRTTFAMNLAHAMSHDGKKVLVVDANFRQPAIRELFPQCSEQGLSDVLVGQAQWRELVVEVETNHSVLSAGRLPPNPAELLGSEQMRTTIDEMVQDYDHVLFDGAPCLVVSDPVAMSALVDGVILVVRAGSNTFGVVQRSRDILTRIGAHLIGVVLNGVRVMAGGYLAKNYQTFYDYRRQAQLTSTQAASATS